MRSKTLIARRATSRSSKPPPSLQRPERTTSRGPCSARGGRRAMVLSPYSVRARRVGAPLSPATAAAPFVSPATPSLLLCGQRAPTAERISRKDELATLVPPDQHPPSFTLFSPAPRPQPSFSARPSSRTFPHSFDTSLAPTFSKRILAISSRPSLSSSSPADLLTRSRLPYVSFESMLARSTTPALLLVSLLGRQVAAHGQSCLASVDILPAVRARC